MAFITKILGGGTLTASGTATVYTVPAGKSALVNNIRLVNGNTSVSTALNLFIKPSGTTSRRISNTNFTIPASGSTVVEDVVTLAQGDAVQIELGASSQSIGYVLNGLERE